MSARQFDFHRAAVAGVGDKSPAGGRAGLKGSEILKIERRNKAVGIDPDPDALGKNVAVHRHARMQIRAEHAIVLGTDRDRDRRRAAPSPPRTVGQQDDRSVDCGWRAADCGLSGKGARNRIAACGVLIGFRIAFQVQRGIARARPRREASDVTVAHGDGLDVLPGTIPSFALRIALERGAERRRVFNQQPMVRRHQRDAPTIDQAPTNDRRKALIACGPFQRVAQIRLPRAFKSRQRSDARKVQRRTARRVRPARSSRTSDFATRNKISLIAWMAQRGLRPGVGDSASPLRPCGPVGRCQTEARARGRVNRCFTSVFAILNAGGDWPSRSNSAIAESPSASPRSARRGNCCLFRGRCSPARARCPCLPRIRGSSA